MKRVATGNSDNMYLIEIDKLDACLSYIKIGTVKRDEHLAPLCV